MVDRLPEEIQELAGEWTLDPASSDSIDAFLKVQGVAWFKRKAAAILSQSQVLEFVELEPNEDDLIDVELKVSTISGPVTTETAGVIGSTVAGKANSGNKSGYNDKAMSNEGVKVFVEILPSIFPDEKRGKTASLGLMVRFELPNGNSREIFHILKDSDKDVKYTYMTFNDVIGDRSATVCRVFNRTG